MSRPADHALPSPATTRWRLFDAAAGDAWRRLNRVGFLFALIALAPAARLAFGLLRGESSPLAIGWLAIFLLLGATLLLAVRQRARHLVVLLEAWPQSNLLLVKTAGLWHERVRLVGLNELITDQPPPDPIGTSGETNGFWPLHLRGGRELWLDLARTSFCAPPTTWAALGLHSAKQQATKATSAADTAPPLDRQPA